MKLPTYHTSIPAVVRYDATLKPAAKLLYGEVLALCDQTGYCWATNQYFAILYGVNKETVSGWLSQLVTKNYVRISYEESPGYQRRIYLEKLPENPSEKSYAPLDKNAKGLTNNHQGAYENSHRETTSLLIGNNKIDTNDRIGNLSQENFSKIERKKTTNEAKEELIGEKARAASFSRKGKEAVPSFQKPTVTEIEHYLQQQKAQAGNQLMIRAMALRFFNYYESNGWRVGRNPMQNWQAAADNWQLNAQSYPAEKSKSLNRLHSGGEKDYSIPL